MKAIRFESYGSPSVLTMKEIPMPVLQKGEVLIQIKAAAINPSDVKIVAGIIKASLPRVPGRDYAGVVVDGEAKKGMEVWGSGAGFGVTRDGCHAEYLAVPAGWISQKPTNLTMEQAAAIGVPYLTAWCTLVLAGNIQAEETVLIIGVSGAVGRAATQITSARTRRIIVRSAKHNRRSPELAWCSRWTAPSYRTSCSRRTISWSRWARTDWWPTRSSISTASRWSA